MHRADLQLALYARAQELGVQFKLGSMVANVETDTPDSRPVIMTEKGQKYTCDLVVGADGLKSKTRDCFLGSAELPQPTGDLAYRIVLNLEDVHDEELKKWIREPQAHFWVCV